MIRDDTVGRKMLHIEERSLAQKMKRELGIARCGLACCCCSENDRCPGCRADSCPGSHWCENRRCSIEKGLEGCYACETDCRKGMLQKRKPHVFSLFIRRYGKDALLDRLEQNEAAGVVYDHNGIRGDYDDFEDAESLIRFIQTFMRFTRTS